MLPEKEVTAAVSSVADDPIFIAIEMSRSKWVVGSHLLASDKVGIHTTPWGDAPAVLALIDRFRSRAAATLGRSDVPVLCCYEAGYEAFWLYRLLCCPVAPKRSKLRARKFDHKLCLSDLRATAFARYIHAAGGHAMPSRIRVNPAVRS